MDRKSVRLEVRLTADLYAALQREAEEQGQSMGMIVREAVREYIVRRGSADRHRLLDELVRLQVPVADWSTMKEEVEASRSAGYDGAGYGGVVYDDPRYGGTRDEGGTWDGGSTSPDESPGGGTVVP